MPADIAQNLFSAIDHNFSSFFLTSSARVASAVRPVFNTLVTVYVLLWGFAMWRGLIREPVSDGAMRVLRIVLIGTFALNAGVYGSRVAEFFFRMPDQLASVLIPSASSSWTGAALDASIDRGIEIMNRYVSAIGVTTGFAKSLILFGQAALTAVVLSVVIGYSFALVLLAKVILSLVLAVGPLMIAMLMFKPTQGFFVSWMRAATTAVMKYVFTAATIALVLSFFDDAARATIAGIGADTPGLIDLSRVLIVGLGVYVVLMQVPAIAAALGGGVQVGTMGMVGWSVSKASDLATSPISGWKSWRSMRDRRAARAFYREQAGRQSGAKPDGWANARLRGMNSIKARR
jgi:type IV secretion system protein VirB6